MAGLLSWVDQNWFSLLQSVGIIGSLCVSGAALRRDTGARRISDLLTLAGHHRELWCELLRQKDLARILQTEVDLIDKPVSLAEEEFLNLVIVHFHTSWLLVREGAILSLDALAIDAGSFFSLPLPHAVWNKTKGFRDSKFVDFIEKTLKQLSAANGPAARR